MIEGRELSRGEIRGIWAIDRGEVIEGVYYLIVVNPFGWTLIRD